MVTHARTHTHTPRHSDKRCDFSEREATIVPTIGFNEPTKLMRKGLCVRLFDVGGSPRIRGVWHQYYPEVSRSWCCVVVVWRRWTVLCCSPF